MRVADLFSLATSSHRLKGGINREHARVILLAGSRQMPTERMALKSYESRLMKSYFDI